MTAEAKVIDLTVSELRFLIRQTVSEAMLDPDPDIGLELHPDFIADLMQPDPIEGYIAIEELAKKYDFRW